MRAGRHWRGGAGVAALALGGCGEGGLAGGLRSAGVGGTPDEFLVLPTAPAGDAARLRRAAAADARRRQPRRLPPACRGGRRADRAAGPVGSQRRRARRRAPGRADPRDPRRARSRGRESGGRPTAGGCSSAGSARDREALIYRADGLDAAGDFERLARPRACRCRRRRRRRSSEIAVRSRLRVP